jgi:hypothetical protein
MLPATSPLLQNDSCKPYRDVYVLLVGMKIDIQGMFETKWRKSSKASKPGRGV